MVTLAVQVQYRDIKGNWQPLGYLGRTGSNATVQFNLGNFTQSAPVDAGGWARVNFAVPATNKMNTYLLSWHARFSGDQNHQSTISGGDGKFTVNK